jgi:hypothetical protein
MAATTSLSPVRSEGRLLHAPSIVPDDNGFDTLVSTRRIERLTTSHAARFALQVVADG